MRPITDVMRDIRKGRAVDEASEQLAEVVRAVQATGKAGSVTIKLTVEPKPGEGDAFVIKPEVSAKIPRPKLPDAIFFATDDGDLVREDPNQREMFRDTDGLGHTADRRAKK